MAFALKYELLEQLGRGTYGRVFCARRRSDSAKLCVKIISLVNMSATEQQDTLNEVLVLQNADHVNIIRLFESFIEDNSLYIVTELAAGGDLASRIRDKPAFYHEDELWNYLIQTALGLKHLHDKRILHRDIKPQNIFLDEQDTIKIGDFGLGRMLGPNSVCAMSAVGTPLYMSPEMCQEKPYDDKSDVWALGCLMYELAALRAPFTATNAVALATKIVHQEPEPLPLEYSPELRFIIGKMLEKDASNRPSIDQVLKYSEVRIRIERRMFAQRERQIRSEAKQMLEQAAAAFESERSQLMKQLQHAARHVVHVEMALNETQASFLQRLATLQGEKDCMQAELTALRARLMLCTCAQLHGPSDTAPSSPASAPHSTAATGTTAATAATAAAAAAAVGVSAPSGATVTDPYADEYSGAGAVSSGMISPDMEAMRTPEERRSQPPMSPHGGADGDDRRVVRPRSLRRVLWAPSDNSAMVSAPILTTPTSAAAAAAAAAASATSEHVEVGLSSAAAAAASASVAAGIAAKNERDRPTSASVTPARAAQRSRHASIATPLLPATMSTAEAARGAEHAVSPTRRRPSNDAGIRATSATVLGLCALDQPLPVHVLFTWRRPQIDSPPRHTAHAAASAPRMKVWDGRCGVPLASAASSVIVIFTVNALLDHMPTVKLLRVRPQGKAEFTRIAKMPDVMELSIPRPESAPSGRRCAFVLSGKSCGFTGDITEVMLEFSTLNAVDEVIILRREKALYRALGFGKQAAADTFAATGGATSLFRPMRSPSLSRPSSAVDYTLEEPVVLAARPESTTACDGRVTPVATAASTASTAPTSPVRVLRDNVRAERAPLPQPPAKDLRSETVVDAENSTVWHAPVHGAAVAAPAREHATSGATHARPVSRSRRTQPATPQRR